jgi:hypothetical protein
MCDLAKHRRFDTGGALRFLEIILPSVSVYLSSVIELIVYAYGQVNVFRQIGWSITPVKMISDLFA